MSCRLGRNCDSVVPSAVKSNTRAPQATPVLKTGVHISVGCKTRDHEHGLEPKGCEKKHKKPGGC